MKRLNGKNVAVTLSCLLAAGLIVVGVPRAQAEPERKPSPLMREKLDQVENITQGLITRDWELVNKSASSLQTISKLDEFLKSDSEEYGELTRDFRTAVSRVQKMADEKNVEGATLYFTQVLTSCVECHNHAVMRSLP